MPVSINEFWKLAVASGLLTADRCMQLHAAFAGMKGATQQANALSLTQWLVASGALTRYQASLLASGRPGPFVFGDFVIRERIESGRLARLFRAIHKNQQPALLIFTAQLTSDPDAADWVAERTRAATAVESPHVARIVQYVEGPPHSFAVAQDLQGQSLGESLVTRKPSLEEACRIGLQAALGLVAMHALRIAHGRVCPENIWLEPSGTVKLLQFPLVPAATAQDVLALPMADYTAPELANSQPPASDLGDVYALGCTLYELIAGRSVFPGGTVQQKLARHRSEIPGRLDQLIPGVPEELADLVAEMLDKEPLLRCRTASHVAHLLAPFASIVSGARPRTAGPPKMGASVLTPGYGAWHAPTWQPPPQQAQPARAPASGVTDAAVPARPADVAASGPESESQQRPQSPAAGPRQPLGMAPADSVHAMRGPAKASVAKDLPPATADDARAHRVAIGERTATDSINPSADDAVPDTMPGGHAYSFDDTWEPPIRSAAAAPLAKPAPPRLSNRAIIAGLAVLGLLAVVVAVGLIVANRGDATAQQTPAAAAAAAADQDAGGEPAGSPADPAAATEPATTSIDNPQPSTPGPKGSTRPTIAEVEDDGKSLWASPTAGEPLALDYLPSSAQVFMILRPAEILETSEGAKLFDALGPGGGWAKSELRSILGVELTQIEQLQIAFFPDDSLGVQAAFAMRLRKAMPQTSLLEAWGKPAAAEHKSKPFFQGPRLAYYLSDGPEVRVAAIAPGPAMREILERSGPPLLRGGIERLLRTSDRARHFNLLLAPSYLLTDGKSLLAGELEKLRDPIVQFLDESIQAVLLSAHLDDALFLEFRAIAPVDKRPQDLTRLLRARLDGVPEQVENYVASLQPRPYGRLVVNRFPRMVQIASDYTRGGVEAQQVVLRCYLPGVAAHNLLLAAELTLFEQPAASDGIETRPLAKERTSAAAALDKKISLSFPRETLERCMEMIGKEVDVEVVILGSDLQLEGITRNQSFGLDERDQPAGEVLRKVLKLANPEGKFVYVIKSTAGKGEAIFITTRSAATKRGDPLPREFVRESKQ